VRESPKGLVIESLRAERVAISRRSRDESEARDDARCWTASLARPVSDGSSPASRPPTPTQTACKRSWVSNTRRGCESSAASEASPGKLDRGAGGHRSSGMILETNRDRSAPGSGYDLSAIPAGRHRRNDGINPRQIGNSFQLVRPIPIDMHPRCAPGIGDGEEPRARLLKHSSRKKHPVISNAPNGSRVKGEEPAASTAASLFKTLPRFSNKETDRKGEKEGERGRESCVRCKAEYIPEKRASQGSRGGVSFRHECLPACNRARVATLIAD